MTSARRLLLVHATDLAAPASGGREMLSVANARMLADLFGDGFADFRLPARAPTLAGVLRGHVDGVDGESIAAVIARIDAGGFDTVFLDGSNLGALAAAIAKARPTVRVATFFHNVEARFFWGAMTARRTMRSAAVLAANYIAERKAVRASHTLIALSERDSQGLRRLYGRPADAIAPIVLADSAPADPPAPAAPDAYLLFVGGAFYANIDGIRWFARHVAPKIEAPVKVVGRGMEALADELGEVPGIELVGAVDSVAPWYAGATAVIAPIFDGSGMKTKVAEAMMHGKRVIGAPEAFSGYAADVVAANVLCSDADAFAAAIRSVTAAPPPAWDPALRALYERDHSPAAARKRLAEALEF